ncbi:MAG: DNA cytosine methyltransferase, partial [Akkermansiaceae bacterium]
MTPYLKYLENELPLPDLPPSAPLALDLFAGCGGLGLGFEAAGFRTVGYEMLEDACATYNQNLHGQCHAEILTEDTDYGIKPDVVIGGPPCQPFSVGGLQMGNEDPRDGFPAFLAAVKKLNPKVAMFENVRGMLYRGRDYLDEIIAYLESLGYQVEIQMLRAVDYAVPQRRERLFVVAHRSQWTAPKPLAQEHFTAGDAIKDLLKKLPPNPKFLTKSMDTYVAKYEKASHCKRPRDLHLEQSSRTVTCRNLNGATGDMMRVCLKDGRRRRLTVREGARLQSFPDWFQFSGSEGSQYNQVGNAVPPLLAKAVAKAVMDCLH